MINGCSVCWFKVAATECSDCCADIYARVVLAVPAGVDYDLHVYTSCGVELDSSTAGAGQTFGTAAGRSLPL